MEINDRLSFFRQLVFASDRLYSSCYNEDGTLLFTNIENTPFYSTLFLQSRQFESFRRDPSHFKNPLIIGLRTGLMWAVAFQKTDYHTQIHVLGPALTAESSIDDIRKNINHWGLQGVSLEKLSHVSGYIQELPIVTYQNLCRYAVMLHYCLHEQTISLGDISTLDYPFEAEHIAHPLSYTEQQSSYLAEKALVQMIQEGQLNYRPTLAQAIRANVFSGNFSGTALDQMKISRICFTDQCARAAIDGGLAPDTAFTLRDHYIRLFQAGESLTKLLDITHAMYEDFITQTHQRQALSDLPADILDCCEYIHVHIEDELDLQIIADHLGYTPYYFARKFKKHMSCSLTEYIRRARLEHARFLLETTNKSIQEISDTLHLCSRTYFSNQFHNMFGISPSEYREQKKRSS